MAMHRAPSLAVQAIPAGCSSGCTDYATLIRSLPSLLALPVGSLTDEVKADAQRLWAKLLQLYEGRAHIALGYTLWSDYCAPD